MSQPFIFIATHALKAGKQEEYEKLLQEMTGVIESKAPRLIGFNIFFSGDGSKVTTVQIHPDSKSMEFHMRVTSEHIGKAYELIDRTEGMHILGTPSKTLLENLRKIAGDQVQMTVTSGSSLGFTRTNAAV